MTATDSSKPAHTPGPWRGRGKPAFPVVMHTERDADGIDYCVRVRDDFAAANECGESFVTVWSTRRDFTQRTVAGSEAFQYAAREQEQVSSKWVAFIGDERQRVMDKVLAHNSERP